MAVSERVKKIARKKLKEKLTSKDMRAIARDVLSKPTIKPKKGKK